MKRTVGVIGLLIFLSVGLSAQQVNFTRNSGKACTFSTTSSKTCQYDYNTSAGDTLAVFIYWHGAGVTVSSVTDGGDTFTLAKNCSAITGHTSDFCAFYYAKNVAARTTPTVTVTMSGSASVGVFIYGVSGADPTAPLDDSQTQQAGSSTTTLSIPNLTTTTSGDLVIAGWADFTKTFTITAGNGATKLAADGGYSAASEGKPVRDAGSYPITAVASGAASSAWAGVGIAFKAASLPATTDTVTVFEADGISQTSRAITHGRIFKKGEITGCPRPYVGGVALSTSNYQSDVKSRWADGSVKFALVSYQNLLGLTANSSVTITFNDDTGVGSCNNSGYLTQAQMGSFDSSLWGAQITVNPAGGGTGVTRSAATMLAADDPASHTAPATNGIPNSGWGDDCKNDYWLQGPVVTAVLVRDCSSTWTYDFGWRWDGTTMNSNAGSAYTTTNQYATIHPWFILYFYPNTNSVQVEYIWETGKYGSIQDQLADVILTKDATPVTVWPNPSTNVGARVITDVASTANTNVLTSAGGGFASTDVGLSIVIGAGAGVTESHIIKHFTSANQVEVWDQVSHSNSAQKAYVNDIVNATYHKKTFWSGTVPGHVRIGHNFAYLKSTGVFPNYDPNVTANPDIDYTQGGESTDTQFSYGIWSTITDRGDLGGTNQLDAVPQDYGQNDEGAPMMREELLYLYNMDASTCGNPNSACAKAWTMLTGEVDSNASTTLVGCNGTSATDTGGCGAWNFLGNVPFHYLETRSSNSGTPSCTGNNYYYSGLADKNATGATASCGTGSGAAIGKPISRYTHSDTQIGVIFSGGQVPTSSAYSNGGWLGFPLCDHWQDYASAAYWITGDYYYLKQLYYSASQCIVGHSAGADVANAYYAYPGSTEVLRELAWALQVTGRAAFSAPDSTPESSYYNSMVNGWLEVTEGALGDTTDATLKPTSTNPSCTAYKYTTANRWDWGRCTFLSRCTVNDGVSNCSNVVAPSMHELEPGNPFASPNIMADNGGSGYMVGDTGTISGGGGNATYSVATVSTGTVTSITLTSGGTGYPSSARGVSTTATSGVGSGMKLDYIASSGVIQQNCSAGIGIYYHSFQLANGTTEEEDWFYWYLTIAASELEDIPDLSSPHAVAHQMRQRMMEHVLATTYNPYLIAASASPQKLQSTPYQSCSNVGGVINTDQFYSTYAQKLAGFATDAKYSSNPSTVNMQTISSFNGTNTDGSSNAPYFAYMCGDHGYSMIARAAASFVKTYNTTSSIAECPGGSCTATAAWDNWIVPQVPYFDYAATASTTCTTASNDPPPFQKQLKYALVPRTGVTPPPSSNGSIQTSNTVRTAGTVMQ